MQPLIGITCESSFNSKKLPEYNLRHNYCDNLAAVGAAAVLLPYDEAAAASYVKALDGILISGDDFDVDPQYYGETELHPKTNPDKTRTAFELALAKAALANKIPLLGICGGAQLLAVALGGSLYQHINDDLDGTLEHEQPATRDEPYHQIDIHAGSRLGRITERRRMKVNSAHHQGIKSTGLAAVSAVSVADSIIEAIELADSQFCLGLQWHPEYNTDAADEKIFAAFAAACR